MRPAFYREGWLVRPLRVVVLGGPLALEDSRLRGEAPLSLDSYRALFHLSPRPEAVVAYPALGLTNAEENALRAAFLAPFPLVVR